MELDTGIADRGRHPLSARPGKRAHIRRKVNRLRSYLLSQVGQLALGWPVADDEARTANAEGPFEVAQALQQEPRPRPGAMAAAEQSVVEAEHRDHALARIERRMQGRIVVQSKISAEPDNRFHLPTLTR